MLRLATYGFSVALLATRTWAQLARTVQGNWVFPAYPDYTTTLTNGQQTSLSWDSYLQDWFSTYCGPCDTSDVDLWVVGGSSDKYQYSVADNVDVTSTLSIAWTVDIPEDSLAAQQVWSLRFIPHGTDPHGAGDGAEISSPQFQILAPPTTTTSSSSTTEAPTSSATTGSMISSSTSVTDAAASASTTAATPTPTSTNSSSGLTTGAQVGIGVGVGVGALVLLAALGFFLYRRRQGQMAAAAAGAIPEVQQQGGYQQYPPGPGAAPVEVGGYYNQEQKGPYYDSNATSPAPAYAHPIIPSGYKPQQPQYQAHELNANVDPAELEGSGHRPMQ